MLNAKGWIAIKKRRVIRGILFFGLVCFSTLFLNYDIFPEKVLNDGLQEQQLIPPIENQLPEHLDHAPIHTPKPKAGQKATLGRNLPTDTLEKSGYPLFKLTINPLVPPYILDGNYVTNCTSPQKDCIAFLYPDEGETVGDIYLKDTAQNVWTRLQLDQQVRREMWNNREPAEALYTPKKKILWLNNEEFLIIIGSTHGTVTTGGDLLKVNRTTGQAEMIYPTHHKLNQEVTDIEIVGEELIVQINVTDASGLRLERGVISASLNNLETIAGQEPICCK